MSNSGSILIENAEAIVTSNYEINSLKNGYLVISEGKISKIGSGEAPSERYANRIDATDKVITPGFINTHHHLYQTLTRAFPPALNVGLFDWLIALYPIWSKLHEEAVYVSTQIGMAELMLSGCTTTTDHHYVFPKAAENSIDIQINAAREIGMRFQPTRGSMSLSMKDGGLPPDSVVQTEEEILIDCERIIKDFHDESEGAMTRISLAPCSPFSVTQELMRESAMLAKKHSVRLHTHLCETLDEEEFCKEKFKCRPLEYLDQVGWLDSEIGIWLAHGIFFNDAEIEQLAKFDVGIAHCPSSNMRLGSGFARVLDLRSAGVPVGLAVDGSASNDASNMLLELRQALFLQRVLHGADAIKLTDVLEMATVESARCLGRNDIGALEVGKRADLAIFDLNELNYSGAGDPLGALVLCAPTNVHTLIIDGEIVIKNSEFVNTNIGEIQARHRVIAREMMELN
jgi:8-oxoguanine deaminase